MILTLDIFLERKIQQALYLGSCERMQLGRKSQVCKEHEQWINELRVLEGASEEQIQEALSRLFQQSQKVSDSVDRDQRGQDQIRLEQRIRK